ncbi:MAG TPA: hypothetical protein VF092_09755 [Longimicrobium sp.]
MKIQLFAIAILLAAPARAQTPLAGVWEGTSICLVNRGVCHDEHVVYHIAAAAPADSADFTITANKLVNGREEDMGTLRCRLAGHTLTCPMPPQFRPGTWSFTRHGDALAGGLTAPDGTRIRRVDVRRRG